MKRLFRNLFLTFSLMATWSVIAPTMARADDWGCKVLLCLANPGGPEQYGACVPPIEKLWSALSHGDPFPSCDFQSSLANLPPQIRAAIPESLLANLGAGTGATNTWSGAGYCRQDLLYWGGPEQSQLLCDASGAINVTIDGGLYTRVWWGVGGLGGLTNGSTTITEYYGSGSTQAQYDPTLAAKLFLQKQQQMQEQSGGSGGGGGN
ncbi:hypothetical protein WK76_24955 [Burkholderia ubonensis]|uniref:hypothetical protein n=1 Tax=Burkholderia ubonensis TaxID=101571 RepID=UPI0007535BF8|nr:hypothetical protein [Burkholderia ubonensis]KVU84279.1 hypothetical protein WK76_24955 [Burkholderia ubonensis]